MGAHGLQAVQRLARLPFGRRGAHQAELVQLELDAVVHHGIHQLERAPAQRRERGGAAVEVALLQYVQKRASHGARCGR